MGIGIAIMETAAVYENTFPSRKGNLLSIDIPSWSLAAGNPCRVIHKITEEDKRKLFHDEEIDAEAWNMICASWGNSDE